MELQADNMPADLKGLVFTSLASRQMNGSGWKIESLSMPMESQNPVGELKAVPR